MPSPHSRPSSSHATSDDTNNEDSVIREVWAHNLEDEFKIIRQIVQKYHYIAMDTEFPGIVCQPLGEFRSAGEYQYELLRGNVDMLKVIQLGLTFMNDKGQSSPGMSTWQFNFKFDLKTDMFAQNSIELLIKSGIQFDKHEVDGIEPFEFAELLMSSGVVLMDNIKWISFHSGYDFGYLLKVVTGTKLPVEEKEFFELINMFFPAIYDIKYLMKSCKTLTGGLQDVAKKIDLQRVGRQHQAGSDSLLTGAIFFKMREMFFEDIIDDEKYKGVVYGPSVVMNCPSEDVVIRSPRKFSINH